MRSVLVINGHDYTPWIKGRGLGWTRNDLDSEKTTRTKNGDMRRYKIATKRTCAYTMLAMPEDITAQLDDDLSAETFSATYLDLHGMKTKTFYCSSFSVTLADINEDDAEWEEGAFTMIEV